jgi:hypothetical protein
MSIIYNIKYGDHSGSVFDRNGDNSTDMAISSSLSTEPNQNRYYTNTMNGPIQIAQVFLNVFLNHLVDKTMIAVVKGNDSYLTNIQNL